MEKLATILETTADPEVILKASDTLLKATKASPTAVTNNFNGPTQQVFHLDSRLDAIQKSRQAALAAARGSALPVTELAEVAVPFGEGVLLDRMEVSEPEMVEFSPEPRAPRPPKPTLDELLGEEK